MERSGVRKEEYIVYGSETCRFCTLAQGLLDHYGKNYTYVDIMESPDVQKAFFKKTNNAKTVPQVFMYDPVRAYGNEEMEIHIGGYEKLELWLRDIKEHERKLDKDRTI